MEISKKHLIEQIRAKKSFLCIGLDTDVSKMPVYVDGIFDFNRAIIEATSHLCVAYKLNLAFYLSQGSRGIVALEKTAAFIKENYPEILVIMDAKFGDIGNTSEMYAKAVFGPLKADAVTVNPYMGRDDVKPFLDFAGKWIIVLALTSNSGADDFQMITINEGEGEGETLYQKVLYDCRRWGNVNNTMFVVGATQADKLSEVRDIVPGHFLLVPGVGAQGGSLEEVVKYGMNDECGLLVNVGRDIIYAGNEVDFATVAAKTAESYQQQMEELLTSANFF